MKTPGFIVRALKENLSSVSIAENFEKNFAALDWGATTVVYCTNKKDALETNSCTTTFICV